VQAVNRLEMNRKTRAILVRHWLDLGRLSIMVSPGAVRLRGSLCRLPGSATPLSSQIIDAIFRDLTMIQGINRAHGDFDNWKQDGPGCRWRLVEKDTTTHPDQNDKAQASDDVTPIDVSDTDSSYMS